MQQTDDTVSSWLSGSDGTDNPAGPLYIEGAVETEEALTQSRAGTNIFTTLGGTTASCRPSTCSCC
jgi:hypothetical protein